MEENREVLSRSAPPPDFGISYGPHVEHVADVWLPLMDEQNSPVSLVILWHGGFWRSAFDRIHLRPMAVALANLGFLVVTPEYRRTGAGGGWPTTFVDVALAADRIPGLIHGSHPDIAVEPRTIYAGHSAGGHLAVWAARRHMLLPGDIGALSSHPDVLKIVALAPVLDLAEAYDRNLDDGAVVALLGGSIDEVPDRYAGTDPSIVGGSLPPITILHGIQDGRVPIEMSRNFVARHVATLVELPGADHFAVIDPLSSQWPVVQESFLSMAYPNDMPDSEE